MKDKIEAIRNSFRADLAEAKNTDQLEGVRIKYMGRKSGLILDLRKGIKAVPKEQRPEIGQLLNAMEKEYQAAFEEKKALLEEKRRRAEEETIDVTLPGRPFATGSLHPITLVREEALAIFRDMGFSVAEGPEVETDYNNFQALNVPKNHPARDMQDTFYISEDVVLRTHTSPVQIRTMKHVQPPLAYVFPGKVFRRDSDVTHSPMFNQIEGLLVDKWITMANLKNVLEVFSRKMFGKSVKLRFRPSFFPFTEPSAEIDISCVICGGEGCRTCSHSGWLEILGAGLVHPKVFKAVGYDPEEWTGFAFGLGTDRIAMLKYGINDVRIFFRNELPFLTRFTL